MAKRILFLFILAVPLYAQTPAVLDERITREKELREKLEVTINATFRAQEAAVKSALEAQKALTDAAFASSEKAISKSEAALTDYKATANEFRAALSDYQRIMLTRIEADARFKSIDDKFETMTGMFLTVVLSVLGLIVTVAVFLFRKKSDVAHGKS